MGFYEGFIKGSTRGFYMRLAEVLIEFVAGSDRLIIQLLQGFGCLVGF